MEYLAPVAVFLFFLGVLAIQARRRGNPHGDVPAPTPGQKRVARVFQGAMLVAWACTLAAVVGGDDLLPLLAPAGAIVFAPGLAFQLDAWGLRDAWARIDAQSMSARIFGTRGVPPLWGALAMVLGLGFLAGGIAAAVT